MLWSRVLSFAVPEVSKLVSREQNQTYTENGNRIHPQFEAIAVWIYKVEVG